MSSESITIPALRHSDQLFIGGRWVAPVDGGRIEIVSPDSEAVIFSVAAAGPHDVDDAIAAARTAFDFGPWPRFSPAERALVLRRLAEALARRDADLAAAWSAQIGGLAVLAHHVSDIGHSNILGAANAGEQFPFETAVETKAAAKAIVRQEAVGVVVAIAPWNSPYMLMAGKIAPALMAGCTVVMKPSPETPAEAYIIAECAEEIGLPPGVLNLVTADRDVSERLVSDARVDKVSFTGSTAAGRRIGAICADRIARCTLELGGKSAAIILDDFPIADAAKILAGTITLVSGQVCTMLSRAIVSRARHDALADAIAHEMAAIKVGHSTDANVQLGPVASRRQLERIEAYIDAGRSAGASLVTGGRRPTHLERGFFMEPTLFANVDNRSSIAQEEIFGPVLSLIPCDDADDAVRIANDSPFGLHGSVFTTDVDAAYCLGRRIRTGTFAQNGMRVDFDLPFGGMKQSGIGREGGAAGIAAFVEQKAMLFDGAPTA